MFTNSEEKNVEYADWDSQVLACPNCSNSYLHHDKVEAWERNNNGEDNAGFVVTTTGESTTIKSVKDRGGFRGRRNDVRISFYCEDCDVKSCLVVEQHKGNTFLLWTRS
jgi:hypothetical protein